MVASPKQKERPRELKGTTYKAKTGCGTLFITINEDEDSMLEVFTRIGKSGGCASSQCEALGRLASLAYRLGADTTDITKQLSGIICHQPFAGSATFCATASCSDALAQTLASHIPKAKKE